MESIKEVNDRVLTLKSPDAFDSVLQQEDATNPHDLHSMLRDSPTNDKHMARSLLQASMAPSVPPPVYPIQRFSMAAIYPHSSPPPLFSGRTTPSTLYRKHVAVEVTDMKLKLICNWLHQQQLRRMWSSKGGDEGVVLRRQRDDYICYPQHLSHRTGGVFDAVRRLNVKCAMTVYTSTIQLLLEQDDSFHIPIGKDLRIQVLPEIASLPHCQKHQYAAFIRSPALLVVWDDDPSSICDRIQDLESQMMGTMWKSRGGIVDFTVGIDEDAQTEKRNCVVDDIEPLNSRERKSMLVQPVIVAITIVLMFAALGAGWRSITVELRIDHRWFRLIYPAVSPIQGWLGLFFMQSLTTCAAQIFGPVAQLKANSRFYSGCAPPRIIRPTLPHITVQCPVYKESLWTVIDPTIKSIKAAIATYEMQGGTANIFVNDDGMQLISEEQARDRQQYYDEHNIGWVARPKHNPSPGPGGKAFTRAGKFKKASNMNYALNISVRVEEALQSLNPSSQWTAHQERLAYHLALSQVVAEDDGLTWAAGNIRIGDYILLIDSDTRVPKDCFMDAASEMEESPEVAIVQYSSGVMNVTESWFEKGITFFTNLVYTAIKFAVANGDVAPFVGHNAFLRWSALQEIAYITSDSPSLEKFWSERTVSEDFDMALRLQIAGYVIRLAAYTGSDFKEGVSLTVYDELARWEKYAYGCSELIFNPLICWIHKGPFTLVFRNFILSRIPLHSKITILAYVGTYFAIASAWILTLVNYFVIGWYSDYMDHYYIDSFKIYFSIIIVFNFFGNIALAILRYRIDERPLLSACVENFKWVLLLTIFLGGISMHLSQAIVCHLLSINMTWGATSKEATDSSVFQEIPVILRKFRFTFAICFLLTTGMVGLSGVGPLGNIVPYDWQINKFTATFPLGILIASHALLPLVLNPGLMQFTF